VATTAREGRYGSGRASQIVYVTDPSDAAAERLAGPANPGQPPNLLARGVTDRGVTHSPGRRHVALFAGLGSRSRLSRRAFTATRKLEPDMDRAAISGRSTSPNAGSKTPAAIGRATEL
jgi:hypothetical protein